MASEAPDNDASILDNCIFGDYDGDLDDENENGWDEENESNSVIETTANDIPDVEQINVDEQLEQSKLIEAKVKKAEGKKLEKQKRSLFNEQKRRCRYSPPGLKIFKKEYLEYFQRKKVNIEDFNYSRKDDLTKVFNLNEAEVLEILHTPWKFTVYLSPETTTPLIQNEEDFGSLCDFLYFIHVSTKSNKTAAITKKALFGLLNNYAYNWKFGLRVCSFAYCLISRI